MTAAHYFHPVEDQDVEQDFEVINRPLNEVRLAFEVLLEIPVAAPVAAAEAANPPIVVAAAEAANPQEFVAAAEAVNRPAVVAPNPAAVVAANPAAEVAANPELVVEVENPPAGPAIRGRRRGRPPLNRGAPNEGNRDPEPIPPALPPVRGRPRGRPPLRGRAPRPPRVADQPPVPARIANQPPVPARVADQPPVPARVADQPPVPARVAVQPFNPDNVQLLPMPPGFLDSDSSSDEDVARNRFQHIFNAQEAEFLNRRARIMARFHQNRQIILDTDSEESADEDGEAADGEAADGEAADGEQEVPIQLYPDVNHEGLCPVCWLEVPNTIITPCGHILCFMCVERLEEVRPRVTTCPVCRSRFNGHRPVAENDLNAAHVLLHLGNQP